MQVLTYADIHFVSGGLNRLFEMPILTIAGLIVLIKFRSHHDRIMFFIID